MRTDTGRPTAKIYAFPTGGRAGREAASNSERPAPAPRIDVGSWYHDAAIREAEQPRKQ